VENNKRVSKKLARMLRETVLFHFQILNVCMHTPAQMNPKDDEVWSSLHKYSRNPFGEIQDKKRGRKREKDLLTDREDAQAGALTASKPGALERTPLMVTS
jgi:hypothetical protein